MRTSNSKPGNLSAGDRNGEDTLDSASAASGNETSSSAPFADFAYENDVYGERGGDAPPPSAASGKTLMTSPNILYYTGNRL